MARLTARPARLVRGARRVGTVLVAPLLLATAPLAAQDATLVRGRVLGPDRQPVADAQVTTERSMLRTDAEGRFTLRLTGCDSVRVAVRRLGFVPASRAIDPCGWTPGDSLVFVLARAPVVLATDSVVAELSGIEGFVETAEGNPVAGAEVTIFHLGRAERGRTVIADFDGRFALLDLEPGAAMLRVRHPRMRVVSRGVPLERAQVKSIGVTMRPLDEGTRVGGDASGYGVDESRYIDMARRQQARPTASVFVTREELAKTDDPEFFCAVAKVPGVATRLMRGIPAAATRARGSRPLQVAPCLGGPLCIVEDGRRVLTLPPQYRTRDVEYAEIYAGDFPVETVNLRGCTAPMVVVWLREREAW